MQIKTCSSKTVGHGQNGLFSELEKKNKKWTCLNVMVWRRLWSSAYLWNGTEIKDALVAQAGQVGNNIRDVTQSISDQKVETGQRRLQLLRLGQILKTACKLAPSLHTACNSDFIYLYWHQPWLDSVCYVLLRSLEQISSNLVQTLIPQTRE